eukprot:scaffold84203_cov21-Tisochrysis_lutea.AAC.2
MCAPLRRQHNSCYSIDSGSKGSTRRLRPRILAITSTTARYYVVAASVHGPTNQLLAATVAA